MSRFEAPIGIITNGLVLNLDAGDPDSYTRSQPPYVEVLVVAGGGGAGYDVGGGGGAGGVIYNSAYQLINAAAITVTIGAGGGSGQTSGVRGTNGNNSVFGSLTAIGGGGGGSYPNGATAPGLDGGSGGGGGNYQSAAGGLGTAGQGFNGGASAAGFWGSGAGGGAGGPGANGIAINTVPGGAYVTYTISGQSVNYAGGGFGASDGQTLRPTGQDASGNVLGTYGFGANGTGAPNNSPYSGESGIVIVRYPGLPAATGGTITYLNGYTIHTFTTSGTFTPYLWNDVSGNGKNATFTNGIPSDSYVNYIKGGYMSGFSTDDYWNVGNTPYGVIPTGTSTRTIFAAFRTPTTLNSGLYYHIFHYGTSNTDNAFGLAIYSNLLNNHTWAGNSNFSNFTLTADTDYIVAVRFNNSNSPRNDFFINGTFGTTGFGQGKTADYAISTGTSNEPRVGMRIDTPTEGLNNGRVYALYIYNRYLSDAEITQNYNAIRPRIGI